jgi:hypothetical protein
MGIICGFYAGFVSGSDAPVLIRADFQEKSRPDYDMYQILLIHKVYHGEIDIKKVEGTHLTRSSFMDGSFRYFIAARACLVSDLHKKADQQQKWVDELRKEANVVGGLTEDAE